MALRHPCHPPLPIPALDEQWRCPDCGVGWYVTDKGWIAGNHWERTMSSDAWASQRDAVKRALKDAGINQSEMAHKIGISPKHLSQMLNGKTDGRLEIWVAMADALGMTWQLTLIDPNEPLIAWVQQHLGVTLAPWQATRLRSHMRRL